MLLEAQFVTVRFRAGDPEPFRDFHAGDPDVLVIPHQVRQTVAVIDRYFTINQKIFEFFRARHAEGLETVAGPPIAEQETGSGGEGELERGTFTRSRDSHRHSEFRDERRRLRGELDLECADRLRRSAQHQRIIAADQLQPLRDAHAADVIHLARESREVARGDIARRGVEPADVAMEQRLPQPGIAGPGEEAGLIGADHDVNAFRFVDGALQNRPLLLRLFGDRGQVVGRAELTDYAADAIAKKARIVVRAIVPRHDAALAQEGLDRVARDLEERADEGIVADGMNAAQSGHAAAGHEAHQDRLRLVVPLMRGGDESCARARADLGEPLVTHCARCRLDAALADAIAIERAVRDVQRNAEPPAQLAHERLVAIRLFAAEMMIDVRRLDVEAGRTEIRKTNEERRRIGASRHRCQDPARIHVEFDEELTDCCIDHAQHSAYLRTMARRRESGFTLLEILVVVGIIGIIAAIAVASYFIAIDRARQKRTVNDMRTIATAWEARATDMHSYASGGYTFPTTPMTADALVAQLSPTYLREVPRYDGWNRPYDFAVSEDAKAYAIRSRGRDGAIDPGTEYTPGETPNPDCDIVYADGGFVTYPSVAQSN